MIIVPFELDNISIILPGVHIIKSDPFFIFENYSFKSTPPYNATDLIPIRDPNKFAFEKTYVANSLVGTTINPFGP